MPGWGQRASADYWSYAFVWWLEGNPSLTAGRLAENLTAYYDGLVARNAAERRLLTSRIPPTRVVLQADPADPKGSARYHGKITLLDYMSQTPITLFCFIRVQPCPKHGRTAVLFELSPQPTAHPVWQQLHALQGGFSCTR